MEIKTKGIILTLSGFSMGLIIGAVISAFVMSYEDMNDRMFLFAELIGSGLYGAVCMGGSIVYDIEEWGLVRTTVTHYLLVFFSFMIADKTLRWFPDSVLFMVIGIGTVMYFIIWLVEYMLWKKQVRQLNRELMQLRESEEE